MTTTRSAVMRPRDFRYIGLMERRAKKSRRFHRANMDKIHVHVGTSKCSFYGLRVCQFGTYGRTVERFQLLGGAAHCSCQCRSDDARRSIEARVFKCQSVTGCEQANQSTMLKTRLTALLRSSPALETLYFDDSSREHDFPQTLECTCSRFIKRIYYE
jgi:hypothetical protein